MSNYMCGLQLHGVTYSHAWEHPCTRPFLLSAEYGMEPLHTCRMFICLLPLPHSHTVTFSNIRKMYSAALSIWRVLQRQAVHVCRHGGRVNACVAVAGGLVRVWGVLQHAAAVDWRQSCVEQPD